MDTYQVQRAFDAVYAGCWARFKTHVEAEVPSVYDLSGVPEVEMRAIVDDFFGGIMHPALPSPIKRGQVMKWLMHDATAGLRGPGTPLAGALPAQARSRQGSFQRPPSVSMLPSSPLAAAAAAVALVVPESPKSFQKIVNHPDYLICVDWLNDRDPDAPIWVNTPDATRLPTGTDIGDMTLENAKFDLFSTVPELRDHADVARLRAALRQCALQAVREEAEGDCAVQISVTVYSPLGLLCVQHVIH